MTTNNVHEGFKESLRKAQIQLIWWYYVLIFFDLSMFSALAFRLDKIGNVYRLYFNLRSDYSRLLAQF